jgi:hypothetical protein
MWLAVPTSRSSRESSTSGRSPTSRTVSERSNSPCSIATTWPTAAEVDRFLEASSSHRWAVGFRLGALYGLRRSEILALRWDDLDTKAGTLRIDESLVATRTGAAWSNAKNERSTLFDLDGQVLARASGTAIPTPFPDVTITR